MATNVFVDFEIEDSLVNENDLNGHICYENTEVVISDVLSEEEIKVVQENDEDLGLKNIEMSIPQQHQPFHEPEPELQFIDESDIKLVTVEENKPKKKKYKCKKCGVLYCRKDFYQKHVEGKRSSPFLFIFVFMYVFILLDLF